MDSYRGREKQEPRRETGGYPAMIVPQSFSFEVLPDVAERVIERTKKYLEERADQRLAEKRRIGVVQGG